MIPERMRYLSGQAIYYTVMLFFAVIFIFPFIWMVSGAMKPSSLIFQYPPVIIPPEPTLQYFFDVFQLAPFGRYMFNSFFVSSTVTVVALLLHAMAGYALARLQFPGRDLIFIGILSTLMIPFYTILIPLVLLIKNLGWMDTYWALIVPAIPHAFGIFWMRQYFLGLPGELQEAARIDGASYASIFFRIGLPLARPILSALAVFFFLANWDSFLWPLIVTSSPNMKVVQVGVAGFSGEHGSTWNAILAASTVAIIPTLTLYFVLQRFIVRSIKMTGLKG